MALLDVAGLTARYGAEPGAVRRLVRGGRRPVVTLLGRNGMGKYDDRAPLGSPADERGDVRFDGKPIGAWPSYRVAQAGIGLVPEGRQIFPT